MFKRIEQRQAEKQVDAFLSQNPELREHRAALIEKALATQEAQKAEFQQLATRTAPKQANLAVGISMAIAQHAGIA